MKTTKTMEGIGGNDNKIKSQRNLFGILFSTSPPIRTPSLARCFVAFPPPFWFSSYSTKKFRSNLLFTPDTKFLHVFYTSPSSTGWLHCYANLAEMYKTQKRFEEASNLLTRMPWLPTPQQQGTPTTTVTALNSTGDDSTLSPDGVDTSPPSTHEPAALPSQNSSTEAKMPPGSGGTINGSSVWKPAGGDEADLIGGDGGATCDLDVESGDKAAESAQNAGDTARDGSATEATTTGENKSSAELSGKTASFPGGSNGGGGGGGGSRSDTSSVRGAGAARVAGLNKAAIAASAAASAESAGVTAQAVETRVEADVRRAVERHAEAMRASMNELAGELAVTTATRPAASQEWLDSRVAAAEEVCLLSISCFFLEGGVECVPRRGSAYRQEIGSGVCVSVG